MNNPLNIKQKIGGLIYLIIVTLAYFYIKSGIVFLIVSAVSLLVYLVFCFASTIKYSDLTKENLLKYKQEMSQEKYLKLLKKWDNIIKDKLVYDSERGKPRNYRLEELLQFIQEEKSKIH